METELGRPSEVKELRPANLYDVAANETWLEDMAREGYQLTGFKGQSGAFVTAVPAEYRYRMQPVIEKEKAPNAEQVELYQELGWEYVATLAETFHVWRCGDPEAPELDTDPVVQGEGYRPLKRRMLRGAVRDILLLLVLAALSFGNHERTVLQYLLERQVPGRLTVWMLVVILLLILAFCEFRSMHRLLRTLETGFPLARPRPYRAQKWLTRLCVGGVFVVALLMPLLGIKNTAGNSLSEGWCVGDRYEVPADAVYVDIRELDGIPADETEFLRTKTKVHELAPRMYFVQQYATSKFYVDSFAETDYYRLLAAPLAPLLARDLCQQYKRYNDYQPLTALEFPGLDGFWHGQGERNTQYVVAFRGREVLGVQYRGTADLRAQTAYFAELLQERSD